MTLAELVTRWQSRRAEYARLGVLLDGAKLADEVLADLADLEAADAEETLTLSDAAKELDMHPDSIGRAIREGRLPNHGRKNAPRVKRGELAALAGRRSRRGTGETSASLATLPAISRDAIASKLPRIHRG